MKLSIIIPHHNGKKLLFDCLESLFDNISIDNFEVIVVDNHSNDESADEAKIQFPSIHLLKSKKNLGYSGGCNFGAKKAIGEYLSLIHI